MLFLLKEENIDFTICNLDLKSNESFQIIDEFKNDLSYIFTNFNKFFQSQKAINEFGFWFNEFECNFIPLIVLQIRFERVINPLVNRIPPNNEILKEKRKLLNKTLKKYSAYLGNNSWFVEDYFSLADITLASAIAVLDYLGEVNWKNEDLKNLYYWYIKVKSRNSFSIILNQKCQGIAAHANFQKIDF